MQGHPPFSSRTPACRFQRSSAPVSSANRAPCQPVFAASQRASAESTSRRRQRQKPARLHAGADAGTDRRHAVRTRRELGTNPDEAWTATAVLVCGPLALPVQPCTLSAPPRCHRLVGWQTPQPCPPTLEPCLLADKLAGRTGVKPLRVAVFLHETARLSLSLLDDAGLGGIGFLRASARQNGEGSA
jgi:hypothetical protein